VTNVKTLLAKSGPDLTADRVARRAQDANTGLGVFNGRKARRGELRERWNSSALEKVEGAYLLASGASVVLADNLSATPVTSLTARTAAAVYRNSTTRFIIDAWTEIHLPDGNNGSGLLSYSARKYSYAEITTALAAIKTDTGNVPMLRGNNALSADTFAQLTLWVNLVLRDIFIPRIVTYDGVDTDSVNQYLSPYEILTLDPEPISKIENLDEKDPILAYTATSPYRDDNVASGVVDPTSVNFETNGFLKRIIEDVKTYVLVGNTWTDSTTLPGLSQELQLWEVYNAVNWYDARLICHREVFIRVVAAVLNIIYWHLTSQPHNIPYMYSVEPNNLQYEAEAMYPTFLRLVKSAVGNQLAVDERDGIDSADPAVGSVMPPEFHSGLTPAIAP
jgi:hypothetical protein